MPVSIEKLIEGNPDLVVVTLDDPAEKALKLMLEHDFSQLPVLDCDGHPLGMVTYKSILEAMRNFGAKLNELLVGDAKTFVPTHFLDDDLFDVLEELKRVNAVLIIDRSKKMTGIVTSFDSTEFLRSQAENLMRVEDIENSVKEIIRFCHMDENGTVDESKLQASVEAVSNTPGGTGGKRGEKDFEDLSLGEYIHLLSRHSIWDKAGPILGKEKKQVNHFLDIIRRTRNDLAHFRTEISVEQSGQLKTCADWLGGCLETFQIRQGYDVTEELLNEVQVEEQVIKETPAPYTTAPAVSRPNYDTGVIAEETLPRESRYTPMADYLVSIPGKHDKRKLTFEDIEGIIEADLPKSAYIHRAWWANDSVGHPQSKLWLDAGWRTTFINLSERTVVFTRIREREKAYIDFFSSLMEALKKKVDFPIKDSSPDGTNWIVCSSINAPGYIVGHFIYSFARNNLFRVELYLDTGEKESTKQLFDKIHDLRGTLDEVIMGIHWERIDDKRGSRIALYTSGDITAPEEDLQKLRSWAVDTMIHFYHVFEPEVSRIAQELLGPREG